MQPHSFYTLSWEQRKLTTLVDRVTRKNSQLESEIPLTISAQYGLVNQLSFFDKRIAGKCIEKYFLIKNGEFAYNKSSSDGFPYGTVKRLDLYDSGVLSTLYIIFCIKDTLQTNSDFIAVFFDTDRWYKGVKDRACEGARNHGLLNISANDFLDIDLYLPITHGEQENISKLFFSLERMITLHQRKFSAPPPAEIQ